MKFSYVACVLALAIAGCAGPDKSHTRTIMPDQDDGIGGTGVESTDVRTASRTMAAALLELPEIAKAAQPPTVALLPVKNSTRFVFNKDILTRKIRIELNEQARGKIRFLARERLDEVMDERAAKRDKFFEGKAGGSLLGADYYLTGELMGLSKATQGDRSDYIIMSFQLIDTETSEILWESDYEVKRVGEAGVVYQ
jgi:penicillin-binding protein activator